MKNNMLLRKLIGDMRLNRSGFLAVWLTFTVGLMFYNSTYPAGGNFSNSVYRFFEQHHLADLWYEFDSAPAETVDTVRALDGVEAVNGRLVLDVGLERPGASSLVTLRLISLPGESDVNGIALLEGKLPGAADELVLTSAFARTQGIQIGDRLHLLWGEEKSGTDAQVVGLVASSEYLIGSRGMLQPFATLSTFGVGYMLPDTIAAQSGKTINNIAVTLKPDADQAAVRAAITSILQPYGLNWIMDRSQHAAYATLKANMQSNTQVGLIFSLVFLFGSGAIMSVLLARQVDAERRVIGTLRALGFSRREVVSYYVAFALIIAITGTLVGTPLGYLMTRPILSFFESGMVGVALPFIENPPNLPFILFGAGMGLVMALLAALLPAWRAATTDPGLALRPPTPANVGRLARLQLSWLPLPARHAIRSLLRAPARTFSTAIGTACGLVIMVVAFSTWDTLDYNFTDYYASRQYDFTLTLSDPILSDGLKSQVEKIDGVTGVETGLLAPVTVSLADRTYTALGIVLDERGTFHTFDTIRGQSAFSTADGAWLGHNLSRTINAEPGDVLTVSALGQTQRLTVQGVVKQVLGAPVYVPMSLFSQWTPLGIRPANQAYIRAAPARRLAVQRALNSLPGAIGVEDRSQTVRDIQRAADFNGNFAYIFLSFGLFLTFVVLFNTVNANFHERRTEFAIMQMQGVSIEEIRGMAAWETLLAVLIGLLLGLIPAGWLTDYIVQLYNTDVAGNVTATYPPTWLFAVTLLVVTALAALIWPLRQARRANLGDVSKSVGV